MLLTTAFHNAPFFSCLRAISSEHFGLAGRASLGVLVERVSALEGLDDKTRRKCADLSSVARQ